MDCSEYPTVKRYAYADTSAALHSQGYVGKAS